MDVDKSLLLKSSELQLLVDSLLKSSPKLPPDILHTDPHPSDLSLVLLAAEVYTEKESEETDEDYEEYLVLPEGWRVLATASNQERKNGYFGAAFVNTGSQQVVVAHRGTIPTKLGPLYTDFMGVFLTKYTNCLNSAVTFVDQIRQVIHLVNSEHGRCYNLAMTGHSLGGWLAQVTTFTVKWLNVSNGMLMRNTIGGVHVKTVVFDSPGAKAMLSKIRDEYYYRSRKDLLDRLDITIYVSAPNRINTCGAHLGAVYRVLIDVYKFDCEDMLTALYNLKTHDIGNFVKEFKKTSPNISEVLDWAKDSSEYTSLFHDETLNQGNYYDANFEELTEKFNKIVKRYKVVSFVPQFDDENQAMFRFDSLSEDELLILNQLMIIQKHQSKHDVIIKLISNKKLKFEKGKLFPDFEIDHANRTIICQSKQLLRSLANRLKQLLRWLGPEFTKAVKEQMLMFPRAVDSFYRAEGQSFLDSLRKSRLNFKDSIGFREFLLSDTERVLWIVTQDGAFEMTRLQNIFSQVKENIRTYSSNNKYTGDSHFTFLSWPRLNNLYKIYGSPIDQDNLMVVDGTSSSTMSSELSDFINNYIQRSSKNPKKLVFISSYPIEIFNFLENVKTFTVDQQISLMDLSDESQDILVKRKKVIFTGTKLYSFQEFLGEDCSLREFNQFVSSECLKSIATNEDYVFSLNEMRPMTIDLQMPFIKTYVKTSKEYVLNCANLPNSLVVISGLNHRDLETVAGWEQLSGKEIILVEGDAELVFKDTCNNNQHKTIYLFEVSGEDVHCKQIFNRDFYVPRKFFHRACLNVIKFAETEHADDLFVICSEEQKISVFSVIERCEKREEFAKNLHVAATKEGEADIIQKYVNKNIHFIEIGQGKRSIEWRYSHGSVESLRPFVSMDTFAPINELTLSRTERNLVIVTDEPGMGKTTSLALLTRHIESVWVIYIELKHFQTHLRDRLTEVFTSKNVASFLLSGYCASADGSLAHGLLEYLLRSKTCSKRVVLMFDGFDELDDFVKNKESSKDKLVKLFAFLQTKPTIQVFLTARKYLKESLETKLNQFSTSFVTINKREQQNLLFVFWRPFLSLAREINREEGEERLKEYAGEVLRRAKQVLGPDMDRFMGVPLQLRMLAEVFRPQSELLIQSLEVLCEKINIVSAPNLYKMFINLQYDIYLHNKTLIGKALDEDEISEYTESLTKDHGELGFRIFFNEFYDSNQNNFKVISEKRLLKLNRVGLVQSKVSGQFQFIHRTYAEYCCAQMVVHCLNQQKPLQQNFKYQLTEEILLPRILLHPDSKVIRLFMNVELGEMSMSDNTLKLNAENISKLWLERNCVFRNEEHQTALHIAVQEKNEHIVTFLLSGLNLESTREAFVSYITQYDIDCDTALHVMDKKAFRKNKEDDSLCDRIMSFFLKCIQTCSDEMKQGVLFACLFNRDISKSYVSNYITKPGHMSGDTTTILSKVVNRVTNFGLEINQFKVALTLNIAKLVTEILSERLTNDIERYCLLLMKHKDNEMQTALHLAARAGHLNIVRLLSEQTSVPFILLMSRRDHDKLTPLLAAAECGHLEIVNYLKERGSNINTRCRRGKSAIMFAAGGGHVPTLEYLIRSGADINSSNKHGGTVLHVAAHKGQLSVIKHLLEGGADINSTNDVGETALHVASRKGHLPIVKYLIDNNIKTNALDISGWTALHFAAQSGHLPVMEYFFRSGFDINSKDCYGYAVLHVAALNDHLPVVKYLLQNGADINCTNNHGETALYIAVQRGYLSVVKYLLEQGADPDKVNKLGGTALTWASQCRKWGVVRLLVAWGADVNADGGKVLSRSINREEWSIVESLINKGASVRESTIHNNLSEFKEKFPNFMFKTN